MQFSGPLHGKNKVTTIVTAPVVVGTRVVTPFAAQIKATGRKNAQATPSARMAPAAPKSLSETMHQPVRKKVVSSKTEERPAVVAARRAEALRLLTLTRKSETFITDRVGPIKSTTVGVVIRR